MLQLDLDVNLETIHFSLIPPHFFHPISSEYHYTLHNRKLSETQTRNNLMNE